jgi:membrane complex biogenesis BtpA family protein
MRPFNEIFGPQTAIIAMIHVGALPGTPKAKHPLSTVIDHAVAEAKTYQQAGITALAIENMHDVPYLKNQVGPEIVAGMTRVGQAVKAATGLPCGIQILAGANQAALAVALAAELDFIRAEGFVFGHVADEGLIEANAGPLLRYRRQIGAEHIPIYTDIKKKHSAHAITADVDVVETAHAAEFFLSDGLIVTGPATGQATNLAELKAVKAAVQLPVLVGSGITAENVAAYLPHADGLIIGSHFKVDGHWAKPIDPPRLHHFMNHVQQLTA